MADRASIFETVQIGVEGTPGTPVAANKKLNSIGFAPSIRPETSKFRAMGNKFPALVVPNREWTVAPISGVPTYTEIIYPLASVLNYGTPTQQGTTVAYKWTFAPSTVNPDTKKTFTIEQGSSVRAHRAAYTLVTSFGIMFARAGNEVNGEAIAFALEDDISMTGSPTELELIPILATEIDVKYADTQAGLSGASILNRVLSVSWMISNRYGPVFPLKSSLGTAFAADVELEPQMELKIKCEADAEGMALLTKLRAGASKFFRVKATGDLIEDTYYYDFQLDFAGKISDVSDFSDEDGVFALEWTMTGVHDPTWGQSVQIDVINKLTAL